jgi:hypothetical protein
VENTAKVTVFTMPKEPPDSLYKFRRDRENPHKDMALGNVTYVPKEDGFEYVPGKGCFVHYVGTKFPSKGIMPHRAINAVNEAKRVLTTSLSLLAGRNGRYMALGLIFLGGKRRRELLNEAIAKFNRITDTFLQPYRLKDDYYSLPIREIIAGTRCFLYNMGVESAVREQFAETIGMMFQYDQAYLMRFQDMCGYVDKEALIVDFPKEAERLISIEAEHEGSPGGEKITDVPQKFRAGAKLLSWAWKLPKVRKAIREAIKVIDFDKCKLDEGDIYHSILYIGYNVLGSTLEERLKWYEGYHGTDQTKWPPRILIQAKE